MINKPQAEHIMFQSADPVNYFSMLQETSKNNQEYCVSRGIHYNAFFGYMRGFHPWHAAFNRILFGKNLLDVGFTGWYIYLDADAYIVDHTVDLVEYLASKTQHSFILTRGGTSGEPWDVNDGVFFANMAHPDTRAIIGEWSHRLHQTPMEKLKTAEKWYSVKSDQQMFQALLKASPDYPKHFFYEKHDFMNSRRAKFLKQILRSTAPTVEERLAMIRQDIAEARRA